MRDDLWADRLLEEIAHLGNGGMVLIDDLRWPCEYTMLRNHGAFLIRLVTTHRHTPTDFDLKSGENVDGLLSDLPFDVEVPAKGLVPQEVLEGLISNLWYERIAPRLVTSLWFGDDAPRPVSDGP